MTIDKDLLGAAQDALPLLRELAKTRTGKDSQKMEGLIDALQQNLPDQQACGAVVYHRLTNKPTHCCRPNGHDPPCLDAASILRDQILT